MAGTDMNKILIYLMQVALYGLIGYTLSTVIDDLATSWQFWMVMLLVTIIRYVDEYFIWLDSR